MPPIYVKKESKTGVLREDTIKSPIIEVLEKTLSTKMSAQK